MKEYVVPEYNPAIMCPVCGENSDVYEGYGFVGGGLGPYTTCSVCGMLVTKSQDEANQEYPAPEKKVEIIDAPATEVKDSEGDRPGTDEGTVRGPRE